MSDTNSMSHHQIEQRAVPAANANASSWRQVFKRAMEQSTWIPLLREQSQSHSIGSPRISMHKLLNRKRLIFALTFVLPAALIACGIIWYATRPVAMKQVHKTVSSGESLLGLSVSAKPKPAPGKPFVPETQSHLPIPTIWTPPPGSQQSPWVPGSSQNGMQIPATPQFPAAPQASPQVAGPAAPVQPINPSHPSQSSFVPLVYQARHDKHFGGSCSGQLTLSTSGLVFRCPDDPNGSVEAALSEIGAIDENGVQLVSGKKYHFSIPGMSKGAEQALFTNWLHQVR